MPLLHKETKAAPPREEQALTVGAGTDHCAAVDAELRRPVWRDLMRRQWVPPYGDGAASNAGAGGVDETRIIVNLGTSGAIRVLAKRDEMQPPPGLFCYRADSSRFVVGGAVSNGGNVYAWLSRHLALPDDPEREEARLRRRPPDSHGLTVLPFWTGERSPGWHGAARAVIAGMNLSTSSEDILLAGLESITYPFADLRRQLEDVFPDAQQVVVSGGGFAHSGLQAQIFADVLGRPIRHCTEQEPSGRGAAILAADALGLSPLTRCAHPAGRAVKPRPANVAVYERARERYEQLYEKLIAGGG